nr:cilia- and flagella-associated protein 73 isoform X3 [Phascolarctos cinereus]
MSALKQRREALDQKEDDLKASMVRFDKFLKDTEAKQSRSLRRAEEGRQTAAQKEAEAMALKKELEGLIKKKEQLERRLHKYRPFARYLEQVVAQSEEFQEIPELMARFSGLSETHAILAEREQALHKAVEDARAELLKLVEEKNDEILHQNNKLADLQLQLEDVRTQALQWVNKLKGSVMATVTVTRAQREHPIWSPGAESSVLYHLHFTEKETEAQCGELGHGVRETRTHSSHSDSGLLTTSPVFFLPHCSVISNVISGIKYESFHLAFKAQVTTWLQPVL